MPARKNPIPSYLFHKPSGQAYVKIRRPDGSRQTVYLGPWESEESKREYARLLNQDQPPPAPDESNPAVAESGPVSVSELILRFMAHAEVYYRRADGTQTTEVSEYRHALRPVRHLFGAIPATEFGPKALKAVRALMVEGYRHPDYGEQRPLTRGVVNQRVGRIVRAVKWGVSEELLPPSVYQALATVRGLQAGRCDARETEPVKPVAWGTVEKTIAHMNPVVRAMVLFQWHTGCRPGEVCTIRNDEIDRTGDVWLCRPATHKLAYRGLPRVVAIGPQAQEVLRPFLDREGYLFSPAHAVELINIQKRASRKSKVQPSQVCRKKPNPKRSPGEYYKRVHYTRAIERAAELAGVEPWHPNQLRHAFATRVRAVHGLEAAQTALGHTNAAITQVYAERDLSRAVQVVRDMG